MHLTYFPTCPASPSPLLPFPSSSSSPLLSASPPLSSLSLSHRLAEGEGSDERSMSDR